VSDNLREDARLVGCTFETLDWNSAAFITMPQKKELVYILILGDRADALPLGDDDAAAIRKIKPHIDVFFSFLHSRSELYSVSNFDPVTHQHNYSAFQRILAHAMDESDKGGGTFALALFDVDKFYILNEKLGYEPGDQVLRELGNMIREFAENRLVGRVGADEFAMIMHGDADSIRGNLESILAQIKRKANELWPDLPLSLSVAFTMYPFDFLEQASVFGKMREALAAGASSMGKLLRVKCS